MCHSVQCIAEATDVLAKLVDRSIGVLSFGWDVADSLFEVCEGCDTSSREILLPDEVDEDSRVPFLHYLVEILENLRFAE